MGPSLRWWWAVGQLFHGAAAGRAVWRVDTGMCEAYGGPVEVLEILARASTADDDGGAHDAACAGETDGAVRVRR